MDDLRKYLGGWLTCIIVVPMFAVMLTWSALWGRVDQATEALSELRDRVDKQ